MLQRNHSLSNKLNEKGDQGINEDNFLDSLAVVAFKERVSKASTFNNDADDSKGVDNLDKKNDAPNEIRD